jgi:GNAT superfamily N-acetyltransferase
VRLPVSEALSPGRSVRPVDADDADAVVLHEMYFAELRRRLGSFTAPELAELRADGERGVTLVAYDEGRPVACGSLRLLDKDTVEVKRVFVSPEARGRGHGRKLLAALEDRARSLGCRRVVLDTAAPLTEAAIMYLREGYVEIVRYNDNRYAARWFEKTLAEEP